MNPENDYEAQRQQLEVATRALHVIAVMAELESQNITEIALDALREMETYGLMYEFYDDE
jgi:hypothetical protein